MLEKANLQAINEIFIRKELLSQDRISSREEAQNACKRIEEPDGTRDKGFCGVLSFVEATNLLWSEHV